MMAGGGDAAAEGAVASATEGRGARNDDPQTNTQVPSKMLGPADDMRAGIADGIGSEQGYTISGPPSPWVR